MFHFIHRSSVPLIAWLVFAIASTAQAGSISQGAMLSNSCAGCHGTGGNSPGAMPTIAGKSAQYIEQALKDFRSGKRASTVMGRHAKGYTDDQIKLIAEHFAQQ